MFLGQRSHLVTLGHKLYSEFIFSWVFWPWSHLFTINYTCSQIYIGQSLHLFLVMVPFGHKGVHFPQAGLGQFLHVFLAMLTLGHIWPQTGFGQAPGFGHGHTWLQAGFGQFWQVFWAVTCGHNWPHWVRKWFWTVFVRVFGDCNIWSPTACGQFLQLFLFWSWSRLAAMGHIWSQTGFGHFFVIVLGHGHIWWQVFLRAFLAMVTLGR